MRILVVAGARPNFVKVAPVLEALRSAGVDSAVVHTGQHYDIRMSDAFFRDLDIPEPDYHLGVGSGTHAVQTARVMEAFEPVLLEVGPEWVVVVGDVNSTLACALVTAKLKEETGARLAHVEAGLRSRDWRMPEEVNRVVADRLSDLLFAPSADAVENLVMEGIARERIALVGNVMIDTLLAQLGAARQLDVRARLGLGGGAYTVATVHRPSNVDGVDSLAVILEALAEISERLPVVLPLHPRTRKSVERLGLGALLARLVVMEPLGYREMLALTDGAAVVLTDSGGLQEETTVLGVPCVTLREQTERPITIECGTNRLAPWPLTVAGILAAFREAAAQGRSAVGSRAPWGWDGHAAERIATLLVGEAPRSDSTVAIA
jgi:UDP-N-acetylglucosamine 2-epimerase (non-hydrolysing)